MVSLQGQKVHQLDFFFRAYLTQAPPVPNTSIPSIPCSVKPTLVYSAEAEDARGFFSKPPQAICKSAWHHQAPLAILLQCNTYLYLAILCYVISNTWLSTLGQCNMHGNGACDAGGVGEWIGNRTCLWPSSTSTQMQDNNIEEILID